MWVGLHTAYGPIVQKCFSFLSLGSFIGFFYRFWSHRFIVSCPLSNSAMVSFSIHLSLKDFMFSDLSSFSFLRILTYSNSILLFISVTHLLLSWASCVSFRRLSVIFSVTALYFEAAYSS